MGIEYDASIKFNFGKYRGQSIRSVADTCEGQQYISWCMNQDKFKIDEYVLDEMYDVLHGKTTLAMQAAEIERLKAQLQQALQRTTDAVLTRKDITDWYRLMARRWHPDRQGGSTLGMQAINDAADWLRSKINGA